MSGDNKAISLELWKLFEMTEPSYNTMVTFKVLMENIKENNCSEITSLDVPFTKKKLEIALNALRKLKILKNTSKEYCYMLNPRYALGDINNYKTVTVDYKRL